MSRQVKTECVVMGCVFHSCVFWEQRRGHVNRAWRDEGLSWRGRKAFGDQRKVWSVNVPEWEMERTKGQVLGAPRLWGALNTSLITQVTVVGHVARFQA